MLGRASTAILAMAVFLCCLAAIANGLDISSMTEEQKIKLAKKMNESSCNVIVTKPEETAILTKCIKAARVDKQISENDLQHPETLGLTASQWKDVSTCIVKENKWEEKLTSLAEANKFIDSAMKFVDDDIKDQFKVRVATCYTQNPSDTAKAIVCIQKAFKEICLHITKADGLDK